ncbi:unnamed protein product [Caenorhabditis auriculariae]|uniref:Uncharacterized protein n=1 Tax=Caenorhabditis auriculariae TaxID=2777116 RepID=A0A8S1HKI0_9PELO|nr:unnamed protein product [Caenorhabditis auriculariae]
MELYIYKLILMGVMILGTVASGLSPLKILRALRHRAANAESSRRHRHVSLILCLLTCFSGGVFLATCFLHLFPELVENVKNLDQNHGIHINYPIAELLSCLGFFLLFFIEELVIMLIPAMAHSHGHSSDHHHHHHRSNSGNQERAGENEEIAAKATECCMAVEAAGVFKKVDSSSNQSGNRQEETTLLSEESQLNDGHCQTHCPVTVHARPLRTEECTATTRTFATLTFAEPERCETNCEKVKEDPPILMKSQPHAHSHGIRSITFVLALGIHSIIEGIAFGVMTNKTETTALFISLMVHKLIVAFSVGLQLARTHAHQLKWVIFSILTLALMTPLGALVGMAVAGVGDDIEGKNALWKDATITILQGLAVGTFLYVTFFEVLLHERDNEHPNLLKLFVMFVGFSIIGGLRLLDGHEHSHSHAQH